MRLFIAIRLSDEMKSSLLDTMHAFKKSGVKGSYVPGQNLHLTLAFIGETKETAAVKAVSSRVTAGSPVCFSRTAKACHYEAGFTACSTILT